jgi:hypothetical protein
MDKEVVVALIGIVPSGVLGLVALVKAFRKKPKKRRRTARRKKKRPAPAIPPKDYDGQEPRRADE